MLKAFYGRYYNNLADGFSSANPGGTNYAEYNFLDQNRNNRYDGPSELGTLRLRIGGASTTVNPDLKTPYTDEISGVARAPVLGRVVGAVHLRPQEPVRFRAVLHHPAGHGVAAGSYTVPTRVVDGSESFIAARRAGVDCRPDQYLVRQLAGRRLPLRHDRGRVQQAVQRPLLRPDQLRSHVAQRAALAPTSPTSATPRPLGTDPIGVGPQLTRQSGRAEPAEVDDVPPAAVGAVHVPERMSPSRSTTGCRAASRTPASSTRASARRRR